MAIIFNPAYLLHPLADMFGLMTTTNDLDHVPAWVAGGVGGAIASVGQFVGSNSFDEALGNFLSGEPGLGLKAMIPFLVALVLMAACGAGIAFFLQAKTQNRWALFLAGAAATSIGTTALPGIKNLVKRVDLMPISVAYGATDNVSENAYCGTLDINLLKGLKDFFGLNETGYRIVIASFKKADEAEEFVKKVKSENPKADVYVGERTPCNDFYPVVVGPTTNSLSEAKQLLTKAQQLQSGTNAYISYRPR